jgi:hypothetical protein
MKCTLCGAELIEDASICRVCGCINPGRPRRKPDPDAEGATA